MNPPEESADPGSDIGGLPDSPGIDTPTTGIPGPPPVIHSTDTRPAPPATPPTGRIDDDHRHRPTPENPPAEFDQSFQFDRSFDQLTRSNDLDNLQLELHSTAIPAPNSTDLAISVSGLEKKFGDKTAVAGVDFSVPRGSILALLGPNGAGKTTIVNMLCTLLKPDGGTATVAGHDVANDPSGVRRSIMLTGQFAALDEALSGRANLVLFGRLMGLSKSAAKARATELLDGFGLTEAADRRVGDYSGGMRRRVDIACGLVTRPDVVFLDEPTTGLDPRSRQEVWTLVEDLRAEGVTIMLTTQYLEEADALSDRIVVIDRGQVIADGTADELKALTGSAHYLVTPANPADLHRLRSVLGDIVDDEQSPDTALVVPTTEGADTLVTIVARATDGRIRLADVSLQRPSLDEVFLTLTDPAREHPPIVSRTTDTPVVTTGTEPDTDAMPAAAPPTTRTGR
ncbi:MULTISPECIES: ATP-binding cassette domain-containing protein [Gordonia]|uniref:ATP-binding cassette domain-containing protein n=1 Tax=Gordonia desulfuricans TaxID=89051 RepID=UPI00128F3429